VIVGLGDRLKAWLRGEGSSPASSSATGRTSERSPGRTRRSTPGRRGGAGRATVAFDGSELLAFARSRRGVEVYLEPRTKLYGTSVLLVADDGEYLRRPVPDAASIRALCAEHGIPVYDAARTGYPRRVRDYDRGVRPDRIELEDLPPWPDDSEPGPPPPPTD